MIKGTIMARATMEGVMEGILEVEETFKQEN